MMKRLAAVVPLGVFLVVPAPASAQATLVEPTSDWVLDYAEERCTLARNFGEGRNSVKLNIHSYGPFSGYQFLLTGKLVPKSSRPTGEIRYGFNSDSTEREKVSTIAGVSGDEPAVSFSAAIAPYTPIAEFRRMTPEDMAAYGIRMLSEAPEFEKKTESMFVDFGNRRQAELHLGNMAEPMQALRKCAEDLQRHWGLDPAKLQKLKRAPVPDRSTIAAVRRSFPGSKVLGGGSALVPVRVMVNAAGEATQCVVQVANVEDEFTDAVCDGLARRYSPALDEAGNPVASVFQTTVVYLGRS